MWISRVQFYWVVVVPGAVLMALEMVSSRVLAPEFGNSVYVWGSIIGVFLAAMSVGYVVGGRLADRSPHLESLGKLLLGAALAQLPVLWFGTFAARRLGELTEGSPYGTLLATALLFGPATVLLATVAPYAVRLATRQIEMLGGTAGHLYAISTGGSLAGTLGATFFLIPNLALDAILRVLLLATTVSGVVALVSHWRRERLSLVLAAGLTALVFSFGQWSAGDAGVLEVRMTPYQTVQVQERDGIRYLSSDGVLHASIDVSTGEPTLMYPRYAAAAFLIAPELGSLLNLGMGGGTVGTFLQRRVPELDVLFVEIDPVMAEMARDYMGFADGERMRVEIGDARRFLDRAEGQWDYIYGDTYIGSSIPFHLSTVEFFREVREHLAPDGVFGMNFSESPESALGKALLRTLREVFSRVYLFNVPGGSHLLLATDRPEQLDRAAMRRRATELDGQYAFEPSLAEIADHWVELELDLSTTRVLSDRFAPVNYLLHMDDLEADDPEPVTQAPAPIP